MAVVFRQQFYTTSKAIENSQILITGYAITDSEAGDEVKVEAEDKIEAGVGTGRKKGHPKPHGCIFKAPFGPECIYDPNSRPPSPDLIFGWDWTVWIFG